MILMVSITVESGLFEKKNVRELSDFTDSWVHYFVGNLFVLIQRKAFYKLCKRLWRETSVGEGNPPNPR